MIRAARIVALLVCLLAPALTADAQPASSPVRIGMLPLGSPSNLYDRSLVEAFRQGLRDAGLIENRHVVLDVVWISGEPDAARAVSELMQRGARLLVPCGSTASSAAKRHAPATVPILFISVGNPVGIGLVESLTRPGGNATGFSDVLADLSGKWLQFASESSKPQATIHYLWFGGWPDGKHRLQMTERAAQSASVKLRIVEIDDIARANEIMASMKKSGAGTIIIQPSPFTYRHRDRLIESATSHGLATIFAWSPAARGGALLAYGPDYADLYRRAAPYAQRILNGTKPADLPVEEPAKFELVINLKTAKALGLTIPQSLLLQATEIIQ
jgi:putative ABC transport system substrate-binding protein